VWCLQIDRPAACGRIDLKVVLERKRGTPAEAESLSLVEVSGTIGGKPADRKDVRFSWRTLPEDDFFLDSGALSDIDFPAVRDLGTS
ncbi:MAG: hypothetical protein B7Z55_14315, partial [Planctomycetales bacterium 12-60-4]